MEFIRHSYGGLISRIIFTTENAETAEKKWTG